jgi:xanthine/uracil permease
MKKVLAIAGQFLLFLFIFAIGSVLHPFNLHWATTTTAQSTRFFVPDGLLLALGVFLAILAVEALRKRLCDSPWTILSFALAVAIGYAMKFGFVTKDVF